MNSLAAAAFLDRAVTAGVRRGVEEFVRLCGTNPEPVLCEKTPSSEPSPPPPPPKRRRIWPPPRATANSAETAAYRFPFPDRMTRRRDGQYLPVLVHRIGSRYAVAGVAERGGATVSVQSDQLFSTLAEAVRERDRLLVEFGFDRPPRA